MLGGHRHVRDAVLRLSGAAGRRRERPPRSRCSDARSIRAARARRSGCIAFDTLGSTNAEALRARARGRARAALDHGAAADRRARPARPRLGVGARQSLRQPAADRSGAARRALPELSLRRRRSALARCGRRRLRRGLRAALTLKWPNDVLLDGAKLAGILLEAESARTGVAVVIGIGVNCAHHPAGHGLSGDRPRRSRRGGRRRTICSRALVARHDARGSRNGIAARASRRSAPLARRAPRHRRRDRGAAAATASMAGRFETLDAHGPADAAPARRQARSRSRPAKCFRRSQRRGSRPRR